MSERDHAMTLLPASWFIEARKRVPEGGKAQWWPNDNGGYSYWCTCTWGGSSAGIDLPSFCFCGATFDRHPKRGKHLPLREMDFVVENRRRAEIWDKRQAEYDHLPWWKKMFTTDPRRVRWAK